MRYSESNQPGTREHGSDAAVAPPTVAGICRDRDLRAQSGSWLLACSRLEERPRPVTGA